MSSRAAATELEPGRYKAGQQRQWDAAAPGWRQWWERLEPAVAPVGERLLDLAEICEGDRVLDVATGIGEPALTAARRVGPTGQVTATDISPGMIAIARERAASAGLANIEFRTVDAEELDFPDASFDAAVSRFGLMFFPDIRAVLVRVRRALASGGTFAAAVCSPSDRVPLLNIPMDDVLKEPALPTPPRGPPGPFALGDGRRLAGLMEEAGFEGVCTESVIVTAEFASPEQYIRFMWETTPEMNGTTPIEAPERQERVRAVVMEALSRHAGADGRIRSASTAILVRGRRGARATRKIEH